MTDRKVTAVSTEKPLAEAQTTPQAGVLERVLERLAGSVIIPPGVDLTAPSGEVWDANEISEPFSLQLACPAQTRK